MAKKTIAQLEAELERMKGEWMGALSDQEQKHQEQRAALRTEHRVALALEVNNHAATRASLEAATTELGRLRDELMTQTLRAERLEGYLDRIGEDEAPPSRWRGALGGAAGSRDGGFLADSYSPPTPWWNRSLAGGH